MAAASMRVSKSSEAGFVGADVLTALATASVGHARRNHQQGYLRCSGQPRLMTRLLKTRLPHTEGSIYQDDCAQRASDGEVVPPGTAPVVQALQGVGRQGQRRANLQQELQFLGVSDTQADLTTIDVAVKRARRLGGRRPPAELMTRAGCVSQQWKVWSLYPRK